MNNKRICSRLLAVCAVFLAFVSLTFAGDVFSFQNLRNSTVYGPYRLRNGETVRLDERTYEVQTSAPGRFSFKSLANGVVYGPIQAVDGRIGVIGNASYCLREAADGVTPLPPPPQPDDSTPAPPPPRQTTNPNEPFVPQPPPMPAQIEVPEQQSRTFVTPKDLRPLPKSQEVFRFLVWFAPMDNSSVDWKIDSSKSGDGEIERTSIGADAEWNNWIASVSLSPSVECKDIASGGMGTDVSFEDGTGWSIAGGYHRAFLSEGGWTAKAGIRGQIRQESGDLLVNSVIRRYETDTNGVVKATSKNSAQTSSCTIRELSLWIDLELAYAEDNWGLYADVAFQPISEYSVSGSIPSGEVDLSLDADRPLPVAVTAGGWFGFDRWRLFADLTLAVDTRIRLGLGCDL